MKRSDRYWVCDAGKWNIYLTSNNLDDAKEYCKEACFTQRRYHYVYDSVEDVYLGQPEGYGPMPEGHKDAFWENRS